MPVPPFDDHTGQLPAGDHQATLAEIRESLCWNHRRKEIFKGVEYVVGRLIEFGVKDIWLDGSFVSNKQRPGDADMVYVPPEGVDPNKFGMLSFDRRRDLKKYHYVDLWPFPSPQKNPNNPFGKPITIKEFFCRDRDDNDKGIIKINSENS